MDIRWLRSKVEVNSSLGLVNSGNFGSSAVRVGGNQSDVTSPVISGIQGVQSGSFGTTEEIVRNDFGDEI